MKKIIIASVIIMIFKPITIRQEDVPVIVVVDERTDERTDERMTDCIPNYNIKLSDDLQKYTYDLCTEYDIEYEFILALMYTESKFNNVISSTNDYGLMQINKINHTWIKTQMGFDDMLDPCQNIRAGIEILGGYINKYDNHKALMAYNFGEGGMLKTVGNGYNSSQYSRLVMKRYDDLKVYGEFID